MSTNEYNDLFIHAQDSGIYNMFVFDIVNSKDMSSSVRYQAQDQMQELMLKIYSCLQLIEEELNHPVLVFEENFTSFDDPNLHMGFGFKQEPFIFGDAFGFTIYKNSVAQEVIYHLYEKYKEELNIDFDFHIENGFYETNDYQLGNAKYFRGYCIEQLSTMHKQNGVKVKKLESNIKDYR